MEKIEFYTTKGPYGFLSNFYRRPVKLKGYEWPTSEHYYQAQKFAGTPWENKVRQCPNPKEAANMGRRRDLPLRSNWEQVKDNIMYEVVLAKFSQHPDLKEKLLATSDALLVEHTENDKYWGDGGNDSGKNMLGKTLMEVRKVLNE